MRRTLKLAAVTLLALGSIAAATGGAFAQAVPDGTYRCSDASDVPFLLIAGPAYVYNEGGNHVGAGEHQSADGEALVFAYGPLKDVPATYVAEAGGEPAHIVLDGTICRFEAP